MQYIHFLISMIVAGIGVVRYKKLTIPFRLLTFSVIFTLLISILSQITSTLFKSNIPTTHIESILECLFYFSIYYYLFKSEGLKKIIIILSIIFIAFFFVNAIFLQPFTSTFPSNIILPTNALYVLFSLLMFKQMLLYPLKVNIINQSIFWFNIAMLLFSTMMFLNLGLMNYYARHHHIGFIIIIFWFGNLYIFNILVGIALLIDNKENVENYA
jgi:hypothetical protein